MLLPQPSMPSNVMNGTPAILAARRVALTRPRAAVASLACSTLAGQTALVTGGSRGIGRAACAALRRGSGRASPSPTARDEARPRETLAEIEAGPAAVACGADLAARRRGGAARGARRGGARAARRAGGEPRHLEARPDRRDDAPSSGTRRSTPTSARCARSAARRRGAWSRAGAADRARRVHRRPARRALPLPLRGEQGRDHRAHQVARRRARRRAASASTAWPRAG